MLLKRYSSNKNIYSVIIVLMNIIYIIYCTQLDLGYSYHGYHPVICNIILPRRFINIIYMCALAYLFEERETYNVFLILNMQDRLKIWKQRIETSLIFAFIDTLIISMPLVVVNSIDSKGWNENIYTFYFIIFVFFQLSASFVLLELTKWLFDSRNLGFLIIVSIGISDAYTSIVPLFYRRFNIITDIANTDSAGIITKLLFSFIINCALVIIGCIYSKRKEFI